MIKDAPSGAFFGLHGDKSAWRRLGGRQAVECRGRCVAFNVGLEIQGWASRCSLPTCSTLNTTLRNGKGSPGTFSSFLLYNLKADSTFHHRRQATSSLLLCKWISASPPNFHLTSSSLPLSASGLDSGTLHPRITPLHTDGSKFRNYNIPLSLSNTYPSCIKRVESTKRQSNTRRSLAANPPSSAY